MKKLLIVKSSILITLVFSPYSVGFGNEESSTYDRNQPVINDAFFYAPKFPDRKIDTLTIGKYFNIRIYAHDPNFDMVTLWVKKYLPWDSLKPCSFIPLPLPEQWSIYMTYRIPDPIKVAKPMGLYRAEFQIEDAQGNKSNVFIIIIPVFDVLSAFDKKNALNNY